MLIKDVYSQQFYEKLAGSLMKVLPDFNIELFIQTILPPAFAQMEWKQRMQHTTKVLHQFMPVNFEESAALIEPIITQLRKDGFGEQSLALMFLPEYIAMYGIDDFANSVKALELVTQFISAEFAVRPFILKYGDQMLMEMHRMSTHENYHVRRFASEGSRPRLPWGAAIPALKANPALLLPLLANLKNDPHEYVRRSVANNLNDITKDNPNVVIELATQWKGQTKATDAIIKHACRSLLKKGDASILNLYGLRSEQLAVSDFMIENNKVNVGEALAFSFTIENIDTVKRYIRLEYMIYYLKQNGTLAGKVFKISEREYLPGEKSTIKRKQSFRPITTKRFYAGAHRISIIVNGTEKGMDNFELIF